MENEELKNLQLEEKDFDLLIKGLEFLPNKDLAGSLVVDMLGMAFCKTNEEREKLILDKERENYKKEKEKEALKEDIKILQSKLILLKRYLVANNLLKDANNILRQ